MRPLKIVQLAPERLGLYGDRGNAVALTVRCQRLGLSCERVAVDAITGGALADADVLLIGGGADDAQQAVAEAFRRAAPELRAAIEDGLVVLAICGGYQLLGLYYRTSTGQELPGAGVLNLWTVAGQPRAVGNMVIRARLPQRVGEVEGEVEVVGYENHAGRTYLGGGVRPLGRVVWGVGNNGRDGGEGAVYQHVIGTYLHGPVLPKNPALADQLIAWACARRGERVPACPVIPSVVQADKDQLVGVGVVGTAGNLGDHWEMLAHQAAVRQVGQEFSWVGKVERWLGWLN